MSVKKNYETKTHTVTDEVLIESTRYCDKCGKTICQNTGYWEITTHHHDWGMDSIDSFENFDICSTKCMKAMFNDYLQISDCDFNTYCFDVERKTNQETYKVE